MQRTAAGAGAGQKGGGVAGAVADERHGFALQGGQDEFADAAFRQGFAGDGIDDFHKAVQFPQVTAFAGRTLHAAAETRFRQSVVIERQAGKGRGDALLQFRAKDAAAGQRAAQAAGRFDAQMIPVTVPGKRGKTTVVDRDECVRPESTMETLGRLPTAFEPDGVCTAGNSSPMSDGAGAVVLMDRETAEKKGLEPLAVFRGFAVTGCDPSIMGIGPVEAIRKVLRKTGLTLEEMDLIELNEAFATQSIACIRELGLDMDKVNVNGGALALGHPLAGTGAILTAKLLYELKRRRARYGLVAFCMAGGQGGAAVFERI